MVGRSIEVRDLQRRAHYDWSTITGRDPILYRIPSIS